MSKNQKNLTRLANNCLKSIAGIMQCLEVAGLKVNTIRIKQRPRFATRAPGEDEEYLITRIVPKLIYGDVHKYISVSIFGRKRFKNGSFGNYEHWIESINL